MVAKIVIDKERCKGCKLCIPVCPKNLITMSQRLNSKGYHPAEQAKEGECTACGLCYLICPDVAIEIWK
ncbi:ferredoxin family protein [bacterium]|nr:ferredoxin family protein [bacterium]MCG2677095.1 ferredoxin family protein [bacterium]